MLCSISYIWHIFNFSLMLGKVEGRRKRGDSGWDGWMAPPAHWKPAWASSRRWWRTAEAGMLRSMGLHSVGHDWVTRQQQMRYSGLPIGSRGKEPDCQCRRPKKCRLGPLVRKMPWRRPRQPTLVFVPENPMDRGAWWVTIHRVTKSQTQLDWLSTHVCTYGIHQNCIPSRSCLFYCCCSFVLFKKLYKYSR